MKSKMIPKKLMMDIFLCKMVILQVVQPALQSDIDKMKADFIHGYRPRATIFYVSTTNYLGHKRMASDDNTAARSPNWQYQEHEFELFLSKDRLEGIVKQNVICLGWKS